MDRLLFEFVIRTTLIAFATAAALAVLRIKHPAVRHATWVGVLVAMLVLPLWMWRGPKLAMPVLPARGEPASVVATAPVNFAVPAPVSVPAAAVAPTWSAGELLLALYSIGASVLLLRLAIGTIRASRLTAGDCVAPVTVGLIRPRIILPLGSSEWSQAQFDAVQTHEREHVRRRDPLIEWLALLNRALFWFHPLAWWLERKLSALAEEACDAAVLELGHDPSDYSQYLVDLARAVLREGARVNVVGMAMPGSNLPQRVRQIVDGVRAPKISHARIACAALACAIPAALFAAGKLEQIPPAMPFGPLFELPLPQPPLLMAQAKSPAPQPLPAQAPAAAKLEFDVASLKPAAPPNAATPLLFQVRGGPGSDDPGRVTYTNISLREMLTVAYQLAPNQLSAPGSLDNAKYDIEAKFPPETTREQFRVMLQNLIAQRFDLKAHHETRSQPGYDLVVAKGGLKMKETAEGAGSESPVEGRWQGGNPISIDKDGRRQIAPGHSGGFSFGLPGGGSRISVRNQPASILTTMIPNLLHRPVVDKTGLTAKYDFNLDFTPDGLAGAPPRANTQTDASDPEPDLFAALQQQLGLKLESVSIDIDVLVVDSVGRIPVEN